MKRLICALGSRPALSKGSSEHRHVDRKRAAVPVIGQIILSSLVVLVLPGAVEAAPTCLGVPATIVGTEEDDDLEGTEGNDVIVGLGGDDLLSGLGGNDLLCGGEGYNDLFGDWGEHTEYRILEQVLGYGDDVMVGGSGPDYFIGGLGNDTVTFAGAPAGMNVDLRPATSPATGQGLDYLNGIETVIGSPFDDWIRGSDDDNYLLEGAGPDNHLFGGGGDDTLIGGGGADTVRGGPGEDACEGESVEECEQVADPGEEEDEIVLPL